MPCYHPMQAWHAKTLNTSGKRSLVFRPDTAENPDTPIEVACGQCIGCRLERSRQWATRCLHEAQLHKENCFLTLTFSDEGLEKREKEYLQANKKIFNKYKNNEEKLKEKLIDIPHKTSIHVRDLQLFMKKLRKQYGSQIRFFACGEYGDENLRPHYHLCIFNMDFPDKKLWKKTSQDHKLYISDTLEELWSYGHATIGEVNFETAAYVARYIMKKVNGSRQEKHYQTFNPETWEIINRTPELTTMSRRPGIGADWFKKFKSDIYDTDYVVINGKKCGAPKFYDNLLLETDPGHYDEIKEARLNNIDKNNIDNTPERLEIREKVKKLRLNQLVRNHDQPER